MKPNSTGRLSADMRREKNLLLKEITEAELQRRFCSIIELRAWSYLQVIEIADTLLKKKQLELLGSFDWPNVYKLSLTKAQIQQSQSHCQFCQKFPELQILILKANVISDSGMKGVILSNPPKLKILDVSENSITHAGLISLPNEKFLTSLTSFSINGNQIGTKGVQLFIKANLKFLKTVSMSETKIGSEGIKILSKSHWPNLEYLSIYGNQDVWEDKAKLTEADWKKMSRLILNMIRQSKQPIANMSLVCANWVTSANIQYFQKTSKIQKQVQIIVGFKQPFDQ